MNDDEALHKLSALAGIEPVYWDIRGHRHETAPDTMRAILATQGIPASSASDVALSLAALEEERWREILPPVIVGREGRPTGFVLHLPVDLTDKPILWAVHLEDGAMHPGGRDLKSVPLSGLREIDGRTVERRTLHLPALPCGYHRLALSGAAGDVSAKLIVAPERCYLPPDIARGQRVWGIAAQLYALRSARNHGIGDFSDLAALGDFSQAQGASAVGINPLHALFPQTPAQASPYSPNSRQFLNTLYLDVTAVTDFSESPAAQALLGTASMTEKIAAARLADQVDYEAVAAIKYPVLEALYANFCTHHMGKAGDPRGDAFLAFQARSGRALERFALHQALCETFATPDWTRWPGAYRDPSSEESVRFAQDHAGQLFFHQYLQWQCEAQLSAAAVLSRKSGMEIGIYGDLAVSASPDGADVWSAQDLYAAGARVGAPPDPFNEAGQEWGVVPMNPTRMRKTAYANFIALLRANMRAFGALRIDHAMGVQRQFWIPRGAPTSAGAYVNYPLDDLLPILALESRRNSCLVIGEDLGTVPQDFRARMGEADVLSYRVLYFESEHGRFKPPHAYPPLAAACVSTHDLPTLKGFWEESDLDDRMRAGLLSSEKELAEARTARRADKHALLAALGDAGLLPLDVASAAVESTTLTPELAAAVHRFLARSDARLFMVQIDDIAGEAAQANMPGTTDTYPNWRLRLHATLAQLAQAPGARRIMDAVAMERPRIEKKGRHTRESQSPLRQIKEQAWPRA